MSDARYGSAQRVAFAGLVIGLVLCTAGAIAPYWQEGEISPNSFASILGTSLSIPVIGNIKIVELNGGLWWFCVKVILQDEQCQAYDLENNAGRDWAIRLCVCANVLLTMLCALVALCRSCRCGGGKTIYHGIMAFLGGGAGIAGSILFGVVASDGYGMKLDVMKFAWAFYGYCAGCGIIFLVSFMLCFASPDNPITPTITAAPGYVISTSTYNHMPAKTPPYELNGNVNGGYAAVPPVHVQGY